MRIAATVPIEIAHRGTDGIVHGHSLLAEVWTEELVCLIAWRDRITLGVAPIGQGLLEEAIGGRTFEAVAAEVMRRVPGAARVVLRVPSLGFAIDTGT